VSLFQGLLIVGLVLIAVIHTMSRVGGALATVAWCVAATIFGVQAFGDDGPGLVFVGIQTPRWIFYTAMAAVGLYNLAVLVRALRRKPFKTTPKTAAPKTTPTT